MTPASDPDPLPHRAAVLVVGIGNPMRRDDGVGQEAIDRLRARSDLPATVELLVLDGEPTRLIDAWDGRDRVVVIDATCTGATPGTVLRIDPEAVGMPQGRRDHSSHRAGLDVAIDLGSALDRLPRELVVFGVEPAELCLGPDLSEAVTRALPELIERVVNEVTP